MKKDDKLIKVYIRKELKEDIILSAKKFGLTASQYLAMLHKVRTEDTLNIREQLYK